MRPTLKREDENLKDMYFMLLDYLIFLSLVCIALSLLTYMPLIVALSPRCIVLRLPELFTSLSNCCFSLMIVYRCVGVEFVVLVWFGFEEVHNLSQFEQSVFFWPECPEYVQTGDHEGNSAECNEARGCSFIVCFFYLIRVYVEYLCSF